jgi:hypothetical protein
MSPRFGRTLILVGVAAAMLSGCFTGARPTLVPRAPIDDPAARAVDVLLEQAGSVDFIATYDIIPSTSGETTEATVVQLDGQRRITIGNVDFISTGASSRTCQSGVGDCVEFLDDSRVSDLNITHLFWGPAMQSRLELDAGRRIGPSVATDATIGDRPAVCVDVLLPSTVATTGSVVYCALDTGVLARYFGADASIELTSFSLAVVAGDLDT